MKSQITKILLIIVLVLAVVTGVLAWVAFGTNTTPDAPAAEITESTEVTETTAETIETIPESTEPETTVPEPAETKPPVTEPPATEPAWEPETLTQADFKYPLTELTKEELKYAARSIKHRSDLGIPYFILGDVTQVNPEFANLDLDKDGKVDSVFCIESGDENAPYALEIRMGNGNVMPLGVKFSGGGESSGFVFQDINGSGIDDILNIFEIHSTGGIHLFLELFTDSNGRFYKQQIPKYTFTMENLHNNYVLMSCPEANYHEVLPLDMKDASRFVPEGSDCFQYYFERKGDQVTNYHTNDVIIDGNKLVVLYDFSAKIYGCLTNNPLGVVYRLEPGGYFVIERMGTEVIRDYWLPIENDTTP